MRVHTLGTSHGNATYCRQNSSTVVQTNGQLYLIDAGEPVTALMIRAGLDRQNLRAVFITHMHADHTGGLPQLVKDLLKQTTDPCRPRLFLPYEPAIAALDGWMRAMCDSHWPSDRVTFEITREGTVYDDGHARCTAIPTRHLIHPDGSPSHAFDFYAEHKRVLFTGDLSGDFSDFPEVATREPFDLIVCEMTHFQPEVALPVLQRCRAGRIIFTHIHDPWHGDGEDLLRQKLAALPLPFDIAHDGNVYDL